MVDVKALRCAIQLKQPACSQRPGVQVGVLDDSDAIVEQMGMQTQRGVPRVRMDPSGKRSHSWLTGSGMQGTAIHYV